MSPLLLLVVGCLFATAGSVASRSRLVGRKILHRKTAAGSSAHLSSSELVVHSVANVAEDLKVALADKSLTPKTRDLLISLAFAQKDMEVLEAQKEVLEAQKDKEVLEAQKDKEVLEAQKDNEVLEAQKEVLEAQKKEGEAVYSKHIAELSACLKMHLSSQMSINPRAVIEFVEAYIMNSTAPYFKNPRKEKWDAFLRSDDGEKLHEKFKSEMPTHSSPSEIARLISNIYEVASMGSHATAHGINVDRAKPIALHEDALPQTVIAMKCIGDVYGIHIEKFRYSALGSLKIIPILRPRLIGNVAMRGNKTERNQNPHEREHDVLARTASEFREPLAARLRARL